jgi:cysteine-rich repeat protein
MSTVYGSGLSSLLAGVTYSIKVDAKDSLGNQVTIGGDTFTVEIRNKCTTSGNNACNYDTSVKQPLQDTIYGTMDDLGNGTYNYDFSVQQSGEVTVIVQLLEGNGIYGEWFANRFWSGAPVKTNDSANFDFNWASGEDLISGRDDEVSAKFYTKLKPLISETYTFYMTHDDGSKLTLNGEVKIDQQGVTWIWFDTFTMELIANTLYDLEVEFFEEFQGAILKLEWSSASIEREIIPSSYFKAPKMVGGTVHQVSVDWKSGFSGTDPSSPYAWSYIWGDGLKVEGETWDDGNKKDGDGWSSDWQTVETDYACFGGSESREDIWVKCGTGYSVTKDSSSWIPKTLTRDARTLSILIFAAAFFGVSSNILISFATAGSSGSSFGMVNQIQLILILPMIDSFFPEKILDFIKAMNDSLFSF